MGSTLHSTEMTVDTARAEMTGRSGRPDHFDPVQCASGTTTDRPDERTTGHGATATLNEDRRRKLTERQFAVLTFIREQIRKKGFPPTLREIGKHFGIASTNGVNDHLRALERKGWILRDDLLSRGMRVIGDPAVNDVAPDAPAGMLSELQEENRALRELLRRLVKCLGTVRRLTPQMVLVLGDVRSMLGEERR